MSGTRERFSVRMEKVSSVKSFISQYFPCMVSSNHNERTAFPLSEDHKPNRQDERERIEKLGGSVLWAGLYGLILSFFSILQILNFPGTWRVGGVLAVSRAFGDRLLKKFVVPDPDIKVVFIGTPNY